MPHVAMVTVVVPDYDAAVTFYTAGLGLEVLQDESQGNGKRFVVVGAPGHGAGLRLARARNEAQSARVGDQVGGGVAFFLHVEDLDAAMASALAHGAVATEDPRDEPHGRVVILADPFGNLWDVIEPPAS